jgi:DNA-binding MarR family transcriptional regulator
MTPARGSNADAAGVEQPLVDTVPPVARLLLAFARHHKSWRELTYQQYNVLEIAATQPVSQADIARRLRVTAPVVTRMIAVLADSGLVERRPDARDRRRVRVLMTSAGRRRIAAMRRDLLTAAREMLAPLTDEQRSLIAETCRHLTVLLPAEANGPARRRG